MPVTTGFVQQLFIDSGAVEACVFVGPTPANVEILVVVRPASDPVHTGAFKNSMVDALALALAYRREVVVEHPSTDGRILSVQMR